MNAITAFALGFLTYGLIEFATCVYVVRYRPEKLYGIRTRVDGFFQKFAKPVPPAENDNEEYDGFEEGEE
jgi:hypothetical protein